MSALLHRMSHDIFLLAKNVFSGSKVTTEVTTNGKLPTGKYRIQICTLFLKAEIGHKR
jgi:hypothetical protein